VTSLSENPTTGPETIPVPEPDLTAQQLIDRATAMRELLRADGDAAEERGTYSEAIHQAFTEAGVYRFLQPRRFGGYEFGLDEFFRLVIEVARGDPGIGWSMCLASAHVFQLAAFFGEEAQREVFGRDGHVVMPARGIPRGTARTVDGGYIVSGRWDYCSGCTYSTHMMGLVLSADPDQSGAPRRIMVALPRQDYTVEDDWGGGATLGMGASSSNTISADEVFVPEHRALTYDWKDYDLTDTGTPGFQLYGNPMYLARTLTLFYGELSAIMVGAARAALDEYETIMRDRSTSFPPPMPRLDSDFHHQWFGEAMGLVDTAEYAVSGIVADYMARCRRWAEAGEDFDVITDARMRDAMAVAGRLATEAIDLMFRTGGSVAARRGSRLQRYFRDSSMFRTHIAAQYEAVMASTSRAYFGKPLIH
jgi:3-hydroxy-9,10-secoandrosta-1,3,5(10)-triene-9,17-dione monooxygenase